MRRLISLSILITFILASCDAPMNQLNNPGHSTKTDNTLTEMIYDPSSSVGDSLRQKVWKQFRAKQGERWKMSWSKKTGTPLSVFGGAIDPIPGPPERAARTFLGQNRSLFNMSKDLKNLKLKEIGISSRGVRHVRFQQMHDGVPVFEGDYQVHIRPDGRVDMANGHYYPDIQLSNNASISAKSAIQKAQSDLGADKKLQREPQTNQMIYRQSQESHEANFVLAWKVLLEVEDGYWQYFVDAGSGQIIHKSDLSTTVTGDGNVISETTCTTPNSTNTNLYRLDGSGYLRGNYANVHNDETSRAYSSTNSFQYSQSSTHFDEVNVYRHIDIYRGTYVDDLGFNKDIGSDQDLEALVHYQGGGAAYYPSNEQVRFGDQIDYAL